MSMASTRAKNSAELQDYVRIVRCGLPTWSQGYLAVSQEEVCEQYQDLLQMLIDRTPRLSGELLNRALRAVHPEAKENDLEVFAKRMNSVYSFLRDKKQQSTSGKKLDKRIRALVEAMRKWTLPRRSPSPDPLALQSSRTSSCESLKDQDGTAKSSSLNSRAEIFAAFGVQDPVPLSSAVGRSAAVKGAIHISDSESEQHMDWYDGSEQCYKRMVADGSIIKASMEKGSQGFLMATFTGEKPRETEVPNLMEEARILPVVTRKRPASSSLQVAKKPASQLDEAPLETSQEEPSPVEASPVAPRTFFQYSQPYKYPNGSIAIRRLGSVSKKQVGSIVPHNTSPVEAFAICQEASRLLNSGELAEDELRDWLRTRIK